MGGTTLHMQLQLSGTNAGSTVGAMHTEISRAAGTRPLPRRRRLRQTLSVYIRLGNMKVYIQWLPALIGWSLVAHPFGLSPFEVAALILFMLACLTGAASGGALDHLQGFRDGIDQQTYGAGGVQGGYQTKSDASIKPLVTGEITDPEAHRFGIGIGLVSVALGTVAILIAPDSPSWLVPVWAAWVLASSQYAYGLKISYYGPAELLLGIEIAGIVCFPILFLEGELSWTGAFQAYLIGTLFSQVTLFSMIYDRPADASAGRLTLAVRLSPRAYRIVLAAWIVTGWVVAVTGFAVGVLDLWLLLAWLPVWAMQVGQLVYGVVRGDALTARLLGWHAFDVAFVTFMLANLLTR
jgi:1,4-dihydroxy-2-naphthoate octaprenyltransferase